MSPETGPRNASSGNAPLLDERLATSLLRDDDTSPVNVPRGMSQVFISFLPRLLFDEPSYPAEVGPDYRFLCPNWHNRDWRARFHAIVILRTSQSSKDWEAKL